MTKIRGDAAWSDDRHYEICTKHRSMDMVWGGHLCEGSQMIDRDPNTFLLWTRCGDKDVPAGKAHEGDILQVTCAECRRLWNEENGQFGAGA